jgi:AraC family transcriptional regulator, transcriptional activator of pobA
MTAASINPPQQILKNKWNGDTAFEVKKLAQNQLNTKLQYNTYTIVFVQNGNGSAHFDYTCSYFRPNTLLFYSPYQTIELHSNRMVDATMIQFSNEFLCMEAHREELSCAGKIFDNLYDPPVLYLKDAEVKNFEEFITKMQETCANDLDFGKEEMIQSYLKLLIIQSSRLFLQAQEKRQGYAPVPDLLKQFNALIEQKFNTNLLPSDYADELHVSLTQLGKLAKQHYNKTLTDILSERKLVAARRELYLTQKSVKTIAFDLGFQDPHYFSRFFKKNMGVTAEEYRKQVGSAATIFG